MNLASRNVLNVFLASPGDLVNERRIARDVVNRFNKIFGKEIGLHVELMAWEDTLPGTGRPQEIINKDVETCDLFVGLLWKRWGQSTGKFSSGFEEELSIAEKRCSDTNTPEIWLFFKNVDKDILEDPGEELKMVLNFREKQIAEKKYLFKTFDKPEDWRDIFDEILVKYMLRISKLGSTSPESSPNESLMPSSETRESKMRSANLKDKPKKVPAMLLGSLEKSVEILKAGNFGKKGEETSKLTEFEISRIFLATSALISDGYTYEPLGVHEINICYKYRDKFDLIPIEKLLILRTMISNSHGTVPGWYWFREFKQDGLCILLRYIALNDNDRTVRQSAINFFTTTGLRPHKSRVKSSAFYNEILKDGSRRVRGAALQLIGKFGQIQDIDLIDPFLKEQTMDLYDEATKSKIEIILKENPNTAFSVLLTSEFIKDDVKYSYLKRAIANAEDSTLYDHIGNKDVRVREIVVGELLNRKRITNDLMQKLLEDPSSDIRQKACLAIIESGENIAPDRIRQISDQGSESKTALAALARGLGIGRVDVDELLLKLFLTYPLSKLLKEVDWYSLNGHIAYRAIAIKYYKEQSVAIESDMETLFERIREKAFNDRMKEIENSIENAIVEIENKLTLEKVESLKDQLRKQVTDETSKVVVKLRALDDFILRNFISAALAGIILNGGPESIRFGRLFINHDDSSIKLQALKIVERFGDETDVKSAIDITNYSSGEIKLTAARVALNFSSDYQQAVMPLLQTKDTELIKQAVKHIWNDEVKRVRPVLKTLLYDKEDKTREIALSFFINRFGHKELEKMLSKYLERTTYYYNVVHSLDKAMYSPRAVRSYFLKSLKNY